MKKIKKILHCDFCLLSLSEMTDYINSISYYYTKSDLIECQVLNLTDCYFGYFEIKTGNQLENFNDFSSYALSINKEGPLKNKLFLKDCCVKIKTKKDHEATITDNERKKLEKNLDEIQKRSSVRMIGINDILFEIKLLEKRLNEYMTLTDMIEVKCDIDSNSQEFPRCYEYTPYSTSFTVKCIKPHVWIVINIRRDVCYEISRNLTLTDQQKEKILNAEIMKIKKKERE